MSHCNWHEANCDIHHIINKSIEHKNKVIVLCPNCHSLTEGFRNPTRRHCKCPSGGMVDTSNLVSLESNFQLQAVKFGEAPVVNYEVIPSQACDEQEGVETGRQPPIAKLDEGTVQTTNINNGGESHS